MHTVVGMSTQRSAADAAIVDLFERWGADEVDEHDVDVMVDLLGLVPGLRRRRR
ncbi:MAG: hypothetical protein K0S05_1565 [Agromyces sp.]|jgi:hypothetical protein|nr:hypothetical protein [Agromyces sp.]